MDEALIAQLQQLHVEAGALEDRIRFIDEQLRELDVFRETLTRLGNLPDNTVLSTLGKGVFVKAQPLEHSLFVDVGAGVFLKRSPETVAKTVQEQKNKLLEMRTESLEELQDIQEKLASYLQKYKSAETM